MTGNDSQPPRHQHHHMSTTQTSSQQPAELFLPQSYLSRRDHAAVSPSFTPEEQLYLRSRLPLQEPATPQTVARHFRRLPLLYHDLAEAYRARLDGDDELQREGPERARRQRMAQLAEGLAKRYHAFRLVLPRSYARDTMVKWRRSEARASRFWDKVLDEVEVLSNPLLAFFFPSCLYGVHRKLTAAAYRRRIGPGR